MNKLLEMCLNVLSSLQFVLDEDDSEGQGVILDSLLDELSVCIVGELEALSPLHGQLLQEGVGNMIMCLKDSTNRGIMNAVPTAKEIMDCLARCNGNETSINLAELNDLFKRGAYLLGEEDFHAVRVYLQEEMLIV